MKDNRVIWKVSCLGVWIGDRVNIECNLHLAVESAIRAQLAYNRRIEDIRKQLQEEDEYHLREIWQLLERALEHAKEGDRFNMEKCFKSTKIHAASLSTTPINYSVLEQRIQEIQTIFDDTNENDLVMSVQISSRRPLTSLPSNKTNNTDELEDDDIMVEEVLGIDEIVANRIREAESKGNVIYIDCAEDSREDDVVDEVLFDDDQETKNQVVRPSGREKSFSFHDILWK